MDQYLTPEGIEKLKKELDFLKITKRREIAERLQHAISMGDLSENAAYTEAKEAQGFLEGKIAQIEATLKNHQVIEDLGGGNEVYLGSTVTLKKNGEESTYRIVGPAEVDLLSGKISGESPLGRAILGKKIGDKFVFSTPQGKSEGIILKIG